MLSSVVINVPPKALTQYTTIKYAMLGLVKSLASEYSDKNIQINAVSPSMVETKFLDNINEKLVELSAYNHPLKRNAQVNEITPIIKMLISKESDYINGVNIPITGGSTF
jgi:3-oxoacyl-[acyl-carrier protein] reductase